MFKEFQFSIITPGLMAASTWQCNDIQLSYSSQPNDTVDKLQYSFKQAIVILLSWEGKEMEFVYYLLFRCAETSEVGICLESFLSLSLRLQPSSFVTIQR
jgi:hypothetical protein